MVLLLNLLPILLLLVVAPIAVLKWRAGKRGSAMRCAGAYLVALALYFQAAPSYMPKGQVKREVLPPMEYREVEVRDVSRKPVPPEERDRTLEEKKRERLPFLE